MLNYILRRLLAMLPLLVFITAFVFMLGQYGAADLAMEITLRVGEGEFDPEMYAALRAEMNLDQPVLVRFGRFMWGALQGDFGVSYVLPGTPDVGRMIAATLPVSMQLAVAAMFILIVLGIPLGVLAAVYRNHIADYLIVTSTTILSAIPPFVLAPIALVVLVTWLNIWPATGFGWHGLFSWKTILPAAVLSARPLLGIVRYTRAAVIDTLSQEYVRTARAKGLNEHQIVARHVVRNSLIPVLTILGLATARLVSGSIFVETVFGIRGFGDMAVSAFTGGDIQTVAATTLISALIVMLANLLVDLLYGVLDPRVRLVD